ncbi:uncharacterized protein LOC135447673 [Zonotrichia leucophrys gambelii]|uniref:uncharacterized protein LOC135447673 n=1 Tax=Zonotrichia leucophrys gambelii TaxID=257770 RepID=UPI00313FFCAA
MRPWGHSPSGGPAEPDTPHGPAHGRDVPRGEWCPLASGVPLSRRPLPSRPRSSPRSPLHLPAGLGAPLQPLGFAPCLLPHRTSARHRHPQLLRGRDVWGESERRPSTGAWFPTLSPTIGCRLDRLPFARCRRDRARIQRRGRQERGAYIPGRSHEQGYQSPVPCHVQLSEVAGQAGILSAPTGWQADRSASMELGRTLELLLQEHQT